MGSESFDRSTPRDKIPSKTTNCVFKGSDISVDGKCPEFGEGSSLLGTRDKMSTPLSVSEPPLYCIGSRSFT